jgi:hypothetical protein
MAGKSFKLSIIVDAVTADASKNLNVLQKGLGGLGKIGLAAGAGIVAGATGAATAMAGMVIEVAPLQGVSNAFEGIAEASGRSANEVVASLQKGSAGMVAQRDLMKTYNLAAQLVSTTFADQLPSAMEYLSKVSAATGEDMGYLLESLTRGVGRLSPAILDNLAIQVDLTAAYEAFAPTVGKSVDELTKGEQQAALMAQVMEKLAENTANMPPVAGTAQQAVKAFSASMQDFKDDAALALLPVLTTLMGTISDLAKVVLPPLSALLKETVAPALEKAAVFVNKFVEGVLSGQSPIAALQSALAELGLDQLAQSVGDVATKVYEFGTKVWEVIEPLIASAGEFISWKDVLIALGIAIAAVIIPSIVSLVTSLAPIIAVAIALVAVIAAVRSAWESDWGGIRSAVMEVLPEISGAVQSFISFVTSLWETHGENIKTVASLIWSNVSTVIGTLLNVIIGVVKLFCQIVQGDWQGAWETLQGIATTIGEAIKTIITNDLGIISAVFSGTWESVKAMVTEKITAVRTVIESTMEAIIGFLSSIDLSEIGASIMEGLKEGIMSKVEEIIAAVRAAIQAIIDAAKSALDAFSPSRKFIELGKSIGSGLSYGIDAAADLPKSSIRDLLEGLSPAAGRAGGRAGGMVVLAPVFLEPREYVMAGGGIDYQRLGQRLMELQERM